ncbi:MAG: histidine phosphatase family protein [Lachnospiraceae bacterium]|nr:histidine phosphatase family protein [Lachnospiraceae bacterium]
MRLYLIRHGETDLNKQKILQGQSDFELNDYGRELAVLTGKGLGKVSFDLVFTSPLKRAKETAVLVIREQQEKAIDILEDLRIQEISFGAYEGMCYGKDNFNIPDKTFLNFFEAPEKYNTPPQGESFEEVIGRTGDFLRELADNSEYADKTILISTHGCALKAMLANIRKTPLEQFWGDGVHKNCAVTIVDVDTTSGGKMTVVEEGKLYY